MEKNVNTAKSTRAFIIIHVIFAGLCFAVLILPIPFAIGFKLFILVIAYNLMVALFSLFRKYRDWLKLWFFVFMISVFQIWPDWFLSAQLNILVFPEDGLFKIGTVSGYMVGLWVIPLFMISFIGLRMQEKKTVLWAYILISVLALIIFGFAELSMWILNSWYPQNVKLLFDHIAIYIIIPEVLLGLSTFYLFVKNKSMKVWILVSNAFLIMLLYLGSASFFYFLIEKVIF